MTFKRHRISRRSFLAQSSAIAVGAVAMRQTVAIAGEDKSLYVGSEPQMLLDDWIVERSEGLKRTLHQPAKQGLIKETDGRDWQRGGVYVGKIVCRDLSGKFHMTYRYYWWDQELGKELKIGIDKAHWFHETTGYATSDDGIHWHKPKLGRFNAPSQFERIDAFPFEKPEAFSTENNFGCPINFAVDLHANGNISDPNKRFLIEVVERRDGTHPFAKAIDPQLFFAAGWPDFVHDPAWKEKLTPARDITLPPRGSLCGYDAEAKQWFATGQDVIPQWLKRDGRDIARCASPDLRQWTGPEVVLPVPADESKSDTDWVEYMDLSASRVGGPKTGAWLGQLVIFHGDRSSPEFQMPTIPKVWRKGTTEVRLVISRDAGRTWQAVGGKQAWLPHHENDDGYDRLVFASNSVRVGDELQIYYSCWDGDHLVFFRNGDTFYPNRLRNNSTAWAKLRADGYISLDADADSGQLVTKPLRFAGEQLTVNLAAPRGALRVEIQDRTGTAIDGFAAADCVPLQGDGVALRVQWKNEPNVSKLAGQAVRVRFDLQNGAFYAFQFA